MLFDVESLPLWLMFGLFLGAAACVWLAGTRLPLFVDGIAAKTRLGEAFSGMLMLGTITSLPEVAAVSTSAAIGNAPLAINNLLGAASINIVLLAVADAIHGREALTSVAARPATVMQGILSMLLLTGVAMIVTLGDRPVWIFGLGSAALLVGCILAMNIASRFEQRHVWEAVDAEQRQAAPDDRPHEKRPMSRLVLGLLISAVIILSAGILLSSTADAIVQRTGIGSTLAGFLMVAMATTLPELSSVTAAVRLRRYQMAVGDIFGTNLFNIAIIFLADLFYPGPPVLAVLGTFELIGALLAILMTGIFVVGLLERRNRTIFGMGFDSMAALLLFTAGIFALSASA